MLRFSSPTTVVHFGLQNFSIGRSCGILRGLSSFGTKWIFWSRKKATVALTIVTTLDQAKTHNRHLHDIVEGMAQKDAKYTPFCKHYHSHFLCLAQKMGHCVTLHWWPATQGVLVQTSSESIWHWGKFRIYHWHKIYHFLASHSAQMENMTPHRSPLLHWRTVSSQFLSIFCSALFALFPFLQTIRELFVSCSIYNLPS